MTIVQLTISDLTELIEIAEGKRKTDTHLGSDHTKVSIKSAYVECNDTILLF